MVNALLPSLSKAHIAAESVAVDGGKSPSLYDGRLPGILP